MRCGRRLTIRPGTGAAERPAPGGRTKANDEPGATLAHRRPRARGNRAAHPVVRRLRRLRSRVAGRSMLRLGPVDCGGVGGHSTVRRSAPPARLISAVAGASEGMSGAGTRTSPEASVLSTSGAASVPAKLAVTSTSGTGLPKASAATRRRGSPGAADAASIEAGAAGRTCTLKDSAAAAAPRTLMPTSAVPARVSAGSWKRTTPPGPEVAVTGSKSPALDSMTTCSFSSGLPKASSNLATRRSRASSPDRTCWPSPSSRSMRCGGPGSTVTGTRRSRPPLVTTTSVPGEAGPRARTPPASVTRNTRGSADRYRKAAPPIGRPALSLACAPSQASLPACRVSCAGWTSSSETSRSGCTSAVSGVQPAASAAMYSPTARPARGLRTAQRAPCGRPRGVSCFTASVSAPA
jgi:hypothetical protein